MTKEPIDFFGRRGFELTFSEHTEDELAAIYFEAAGWSREELRKHLSRGDVGRVFADLRGRNGLELQGYGTGNTETAAADRAMQRWKQEQGD
jgi:hypothetical protein